MSLYISSLNSGSNGNCYYIGNQHEAVLVDAGISCRETEFRMDRAGLSINKVKAIFVTHEHTDHTRGVEVLSRKYKIPVFISQTTLGNSRLSIGKDLVRHFDADTPVMVGGLSINAFAKNHDASDPYSFTVSNNGVTVGVFTDMGSVCENLIHNFSLCNAAFLEANYDEEMLEKGNYPFYLKRRIRSNEGHLSNLQSLGLFTKYRSEFLSHLLLSHLSQHNNDPKLVEDLFNTDAGFTHIAVASRYQESAVYRISRPGSGSRHQNDINIVPGTIQLSLF